MKSAAGCLRNDKGWTVGLVAWTVIEGKTLVLLVAFVDLAIFAMVIIGLVRVNWRIWRVGRTKTKIR